LIVEQKNPVEQGGGKSMAVTERPPARAALRTLRKYFDAASDAGENIRKYRQTGQRANRAAGRRA
jgi:hypothetical protein